MGQASSLRDPSGNLIELFEPKKRAYDALALPSLFALLLIVLEGLDQPTQYLGGRFEHRFELRLVNLDDIFSQVFSDFLEPLLHLLNVVLGVAVCWGRHELLLWLREKRAKRSVSSHVRDGPL